MLLVEQAELFARLVHKNQFYGELPYERHLEEVVLTLQEFGIRDGIVLSAAWLHNSLENTIVTHPLLESIFGSEVADIVFDVTNEPGKNRKEILEKTASKTKENYAALTIKLAGRIVNTEFSIDNNLKLYKMYKKEFPRFKELLYRENEKDRIVIDLWEHLEALYSDKVNFDNDELPRYRQKELRELESEDLLLGDEREAKYYDDCYERVEELMYDQ